MKGVIFARKAIHFDKDGRGCSAFYYDLIHHPFNKIRGIRLFLRQIANGISLIRK